MQETLAAAVTQACPVCDARAALLDVVDFNKSCEELRGRFLPLAGTPVYYALCATCGFCFAPELHAWRLEKFAERVYNDDYILVDPDYLRTRPQVNADSLMKAIGDGKKGIRHLDYGGGHGLLSDLLRDSGWQSSSYDPFVDRGVDPRGLGKFDLITAFEVFEHVPDVRKLMEDLAALRTTDGIILFTTLVSDGNIAPRQRLTWWYASPRNGHISLYTKRSLTILGQRVGLGFKSSGQNLHAFGTGVPPPWSHGLFGD